MVSSETVHQEQYYDLGINWCYEKHRGSATTNLRYVCKKGDMVIMQEGHYVKQAF